MSRLGSQRRQETYSPSRPRTHSFSKLLLELVEELPVAAQIARFQQGSSGDHVCIGQLDRLRDRAGGVADLVANIPELRQSLANDFFRFPRGLRICRREHNIDITEGDEFPATVSTQGGDNEWFGEAFWNHGADHAFEELLKEDVNQIRALARNFASAAPRVVPHSQAMFFDLAKPRKISMLSPTRLRAFSRSARAASSRACSLGVIIRCGAQASQGAADHSHLLKPTA